MKIDLLSTSYLNSKDVYSHFKNNKVSLLGDFTDDFILINELVPFPFYLNYKMESAKANNFLEAFDIFKKYYVDLDQELIFNQKLWHTLLLTEFREYVIQKYPSVLTDENKFKTIVLKKFDWENYIYKIALLTGYIVDNIESRFHSKYVILMAENMDIINYSIKYKFFRNDIFLINILDIIDENNLSKRFKAKIKSMKGDQRYGRRVIFELNKRYPVSMFHALTKDMLKVELINILENYEKL